MDTRYLCFWPRHTQRRAGERLRELQKQKGKTHICIPVIIVNLFCYGFIKHTCHILCRHKIIVWLTSILLQNTDLICLYNDLVFFSWFDHYFYILTFVSRLQPFPLAPRKALGLFLENGDQWKKSRASLTPAFSSGKLRNMFATINDSVDHLVANTDEKCKVGDTYDVYEWVSFIFLNLL